MSTYFFVNLFFIIYDYLLNLHTMENQEIKPFKDSMNYGLLIGVALMVTFFILYSLFSFEQLTKTSWITYIVLFVGLAISTIKYRNEKYDGYIPFGKSFTFMLFVSIWASALLAILYYLFYSFYDASLITQMLELVEEKVYEKMPNISDEEFDTIIAIQSKFINPITIAIGTLFYTIVAGLIFGLIASLFIKKDKPIEIEES